MEGRTFEIPVFSQNMEKQIYSVTEFEKDFFAVFYQDSKIGEIQVAKTGQILHWFVNSGDDRNLLLEIADRILPAVVFDYCKKLRYHLTNKAGLSISDIEWLHLPTSRIEFIIQMAPLTGRQDADHLKNVLLSYFNNKKNKLPAGEFNYKILANDSTVLVEEEYWNIGN